MKPCATQGERKEREKEQGAARKAAEAAARALRDHDCAQATVDEKKKHLTVLLCFILGVGGCAADRGTST